MVKFAPVAPVHILHDLVAHKEFKDYHLFLAHHTVEHPKEFAYLFDRYYGDRQGQGHPTVIMDNSIVELGGAVDDLMIDEACRIISAAGRSTTIVPVLPDVMGIGYKTVELSRAAYHRWANLGKQGAIHANTYMLVTQGESWDDFTATVNHFFIDMADDYPRIGWVGIPRRLLDVLPTRAEAIKYIQMVAPHVKIHLLGFSGSIGDDLLCARLPGVMGIDSAVPVRYNGVLTPMTTEDEIGPRGDWFKEGQLNSTNIHNVQNVRKWIGQTY
jgi:hypothetical protein